MNPRTPAFRSLPLPVLLNQPKTPGCPILRAPDRPTGGEPILSGRRLCSYLALSLPLLRRAQTSPLPLPLDRPGLQPGIYALLHYKPEPGLNSPML